MNTTQLDPAVHQYGFHLMQPEALLLPNVRMPPIGTPGRLLAGTMRLSHRPRLRPGGLTGRVPVVPGQDGQLVDGQAEIRERPAQGRRPVGPGRRHRRTRPRRGRDGAEACLPERAPQPQHVLLAWSLEHCMGGAHRPVAVPAVTELNCRTSAVRCPWPVHPEETRSLSGRALHPLPAGTMRGRRHGSSLPAPPLVSPATNS